MRIRALTALKKPDRTAQQKISGEHATQVREVRVEDSVQEYIVRVARTTRDHEEVDLGASPRATMALYRTSQAWAAIQGREFVLPDDVKFLAPAVITHRIMLDPQMRLRGRRPEEVVADIVQTVPVPVES